MSSYKDRENAVTVKTVSAELGRMRSPTLPFLKQYLPFEKSCPPVNGAGCRQQEYLQPTNPLARGQAFDLISLSNRHILVNNSGRRQNPSISPSTSLRPLEAASHAHGHWAGLFCSLGFEVLLFPFLVSPSSASTSASL